MSDSIELENIRGALDKSAIVAITDRSGKITHVNDKFCEISKYSREELVGQNHRLINSGYHPKEFFSHMWSTISKGKTWTGEIRNRSKDGGIYWVYTTIVPYLDEQGIPYQFVSIRFEITQRKFAEEKVEQYAMQTVMQDRLASIGLLASGLAHEIGTPLGIIRGRAEMLARQLNSNADAKNNADIIVSQIDRISALIRSLLNLARGSKDNLVGHVRLSQSVKDVLDLMSHEISKNNIEIRNECDLTDFLVMASQGPLHQVLLNLFVNAIHAIQSAIKDGRTGDHFLRIGARQNNSGMVILEVEDSGCGISPENMKNIFKPFFTTKDVGAGTGLGLATSYRIVQEWGGDISVESKFHSGTIFRIHLPQVR